LLQQYLDDIALYGAALEHNIKLENLTVTRTNATITNGNAWIDDMELQPAPNLTNEQKAAIEGLKAHIGNEPAIVDTPYMLEMLSDYQLPVVARNQLDNGKSSNLWYEQVLPRETRFYFVVLVPDDDTKNFWKTFEDNIKAYPVQIGANASVGYGFCKIELITTKPLTHAAN
jgi:CRISPR-associated protein Cmr4